MNRIPVQLKHRILAPAKHIRNGLRDKVFWVWRTVVFEAGVDELRRITPDIAVSYRFGDMSDVDLLDMEHHEYDSEARRFARERLQAGDRLMLGFHEGVLIFYGWLMFKAMEVHHRRYMPISSDRAHAYNGFTVREHRGKHIAAGVSALISDHLKQAGYRKAVSSVDAGNRHSLRSKMKAGYRPVGHIVKIRVLSRVLCFLGRKLRGRLLDGEISCELES